MDKPEEVGKNNIVVVGVFKTAIVLVPAVDSSFCYLVSYNEKLQVKDCNKIDLTGCIKSDVRLYWGCLLERYIAEVGKALLVTSWNLLALVDMRTFQISQIVEYLMPYEPTEIYFMWSKDGKSLKYFMEKGSRKMVFIEICSL